MCEQILHYYKMLLHTVQYIRRTEKKEENNFNTWMVKGKMCTVTKGAQAFKLVTAICNLMA